MENILRNNITIIFLLFFSTVAFTQPTFQKKFRITSYCYSVSVQQTFDGGYIVFGYADDCWLIKLNANGDTTWTKSYGTNFLDVIYSGQQTSDSGFIFTGYTNVTNPYYTYVYLIKTNSLGDTLWTKTYGHPVQCKAYSVKQLNDGGYIICGSAGDLGGWLDFFLLRTNSFGDTLWTKQYSSSSNGAKIAYSVIQTFDNGFIFCGSRFDDIAIVKTDSIGNIIWSKIIPNAVSAYSIIQTADSGYVIGAHLNYDFGLLKINSIGDVVWAKSIGNSYNDGCMSIIQTSDGCIIGAGGTNLNNMGSCKILIVKTNMNGDTIFTRAIGASASYSGNTASCINETSDKGFIIGGMTDGFGGGNNFYCIKVDSLGYSQCNELTIPISVNAPTIQTSNHQFFNSTTIWNLYPTITYINGGCSDTTLCTSVGINEIAIDNSFLVFPNPSSGNFIISFQRMIVKGNVEILNILGENIFTENIFNKSKKEIKLKDVLEGIYFVKVFDGEKNYCKKLIIE